MRVQTAKTRELVVEDRRLQHGRCAAR
jgi:hypothetical protein